MFSPVTQDHKICISCNITIGTLKAINNLNYNINETIFDTTSDIPFQNSNTIEPILNDHKLQHNTNTDLHPQSNHANKINFHHNKTQNVTTYIKEDDHNNTSIKPLRPSNRIEKGEIKQLPSPIKDPNIIISPTEVNYYRKVILKGIDTNTKEQLEAMCKDYDIFSKHVTDIGKMI